MRVHCRAVTGLLLLQHTRGPARRYCRMTKLTDDLGYRPYPLSTHAHLHDETRLTAMNSLSMHFFFKYSYRIPEERGLEAQWGTASLTVGASNVIVSWSIYLGLANLVLRSTLSFKFIRPSLPE